MLCLDYSVVWLNDLGLKMFFKYFVVFTTQFYIMTFLFAKKTPIANGMQIWMPDEKHKKLFCQNFYSTENNDSVNAFVSQEFIKGEGIIGQAWANRGAHNW